MAERKPLFMQTEGYHEEMDPTDTMTLGGLTMEGAIDMNSSKITNCGAATTAGDVLVYGQNGAQLGQDFQVTATTGHPTVLNGPSTIQGPVTQGATSFTADVSLGNNQITNLNEPVNPGDAANKAYVDAVASGLNVHDHVQAASTANINLAGAFPTTLDGYTLVAGDRILLKDQTNQIDNGIYIVASPVTSPPTRAADLTTGNHAQGVYVFVQFGTTNGGTGWSCTAVAPNDVVGTNNLPWGQFSSTGHISAGDGIAISTGTVSVNLATNPGLMFDASSPGKLEVKPDGTKGIEVGAGGVAVKIDGTTVSFDGTGHLQVLGAGSAASLELMNVIAAGAVAAGDPVYWGAVDKVTKGLSNNDAKSRIIGVALTAAADGVATNVVGAGLAVGILTGATVNTPYYLQTTGGIGTSLPGASNRVIQVGYAKNATDLWVEIKDYGKKAA
jgi:hypothetical protein